MPEMVRIVDNSIKKKNPEEREYLICITGSNGEEDYWIIINGRSNAFEHIKENVEYIDFNESFILVENLALANRISLYAFMKEMEKHYPNDPFRIDEYINGDWSEEDYRNRNEINTSIDIASSERLNMADLMNGNVQTTSLE